MAGKQALTVLLAGLAGALVFSCGGNVANSDTRQGVFPQQFHTSGTMIVDESNRETVFRGASIESPIVLSHSLQDKVTTGQYYFDQYLEWNESIFQNLSLWGADIVRLPVYPSAWRIFGSADCLQILDEAIGWAAKNKLYVIIDFHSIGFPTTGDYESNVAGAYGELYTTTQSEILSFWSIVAEHYKNDTTVAFYELFNEPVFPSFATSTYSQSTVNWSAWKTFAEEVTDTIRSHDPSSTIIVGGLDWAYDLSYLSNAANALNRSNIIYSVHPYPGAMAFMDSTVADWDVTFGTVSANYPIFASEIGFLLDNPNDAPYYEGLFVGVGAYRDAIKAYLNGRKISWTAWCFSPFTWPKLLQDKNYTSTVAGSFMKQWMQEQNAASPVK